jgi:hypothetical protein
MSEAEIDFAAILGVPDVNEFTVNKLKQSWIGRNELNRRDLTDGMKAAIIESTYPEIQALKFIEDRTFVPIWGLIVYRTTYSDEEKWTHFNHLFQEGVRKFVRNINEYGDLAHLDHLDFTVRDNKDLFDNASKSDLRNHFREWLKSDDVFLEQGLNRSDDPEAIDSSGSLRYSYFIEVNEEAMQSVLQNGTETGYVNFVWLDDPSYDEMEDDDAEDNDDEDEEDDAGRNKAKEKEGEDEDGNGEGADGEYDMKDQDGKHIPFSQDDGFEVIEGSTAEHVGFQKIAVEHIYPHYWGQMIRLGEDWVLTYTRPPAIRGIHD